MKWTIKEIDLLRASYKRKRNYMKAAIIASTLLPERTTLACYSKMLHLARLKAKLKVKPVCRELKASYMVTIPKFQEKWFCQFPPQMKHRVKKIYVVLE